MRPWSARAYIDAACYALVALIFLVILGPVFF